MKLPRNLLTGTMEKPRLFLCETDKSVICELDTIELSGSFKFNAYSELTFTIPRTYTNMTTGDTQINPYYNKIEALRIVYLEGFGYFEIQDPELISDGIREVKNVTAYSLEYTLSQKYIEDLKINTGDVDSLEVIEANGGDITPIALYDGARPNLSLLNIILEKIYGWKIGHVDESLKTMGRTFEISRVSVYDFIVQDICEKFNCFAIFDTVNNTINIHAETLITKYIGNGETSFFDNPYKEIGSVTIDGYRLNQTDYDIASMPGYIVFNNVPEKGARIEITDGSQIKWATDVYVSFDNLAQEVNVSYSADDIKTVLTVKGADDMDIREVNMGLPYIVDISYYYTIDWMGQELYDVYTLYLQNYNSGQIEYKDNATDMLELSGRIAYEENRLSLQYVIATVASDTLGTYYIRGEESSDGSGDYYYKEVKLPDEWNANATYYTLSGSSLNEDKFSNFYEALKTYFISESNKDTSKLSELSDSFSFMKTYTMSYLVDELKNASTIDNKKIAISNFLNELFNQLGLTPLKTLYYDPYKQIEQTNIEAGWNVTTSDSYWSYYPVTLVLASLEEEIKERENTIEVYEDKYAELSKKNNDITDSVLVATFFKNYFKEQGLDDYESNTKATQLLVRLSSFLREDEYTDDNFIETNIDTIETIMQTKKELLECGRIELSKLCEPKLSFSMDMANIYALPEFEPIINQFQLGNLINVAIRSDYIKRARLLEVNINFDDFSDFTCEFGELTNLKTPSSIHADLLSSALSAGKSVASSASYWNQGTERVMALELQVAEGLSNAVRAVKNNDGTQHVSTNQYGIRLQKYDSVGNLDPKEGWIVNNQFLYSDDNFATAKSVFGEYIINGQTKWGLLAEAVMAGYVSGCTIEGGTIKIGLQADGTYAFEVHEDGSVTMSGGSSIKGYAKEEDVNDLGSQVQAMQGKFETINNSKMYRVEIQCSGPMIMSLKTQKATLSCKVYSWDVDITDTLDASLFNWIRVSDNIDQDEIWNNNTTHQGRKTLTITTEDIANNANFYCEVSLPE